MEFRGHILNRVQSFASPRTDLIFKHKILSSCDTNLSSKLQLSDAGTQGINTAKTPKLYTGIGLGDATLGRALNKT